jgi:hypothetical protein
MAKKCNICGKEAKYLVKDSRDFYCEECAEEQFGDIAMLVRVEDQAVKLKKVVDEKLSDEPDEACACEPDINSETKDPE